ncbi:SRPBCC family protein [Actinomadura barringtoniae]|uniref:SRPBCC family protein n=1 Tax=Actinomadura barringtoniae TaxID=1427535 RepID=A0A939PGG0_9ACTN|nr:SRPBCC family protein [Actinomadura barringtoniae]MBO2449628.1 SRPBCC family protein [Actinomadura barringtoniae]
MSLSVSTPSDTEVVLTRTFAAPPARVFAAFTQPNLLRRWHGARGWNLVVCEVDLRPGGAWRFVSRNQDSGAEMTMSGLYREVERPTRIVNTETHDDWTEGTALITTVFDERDGRTAMATTARYPSREIRDLVLRSPMERGAGEAYDRLAELLNTTT